MATTAKEMINRINAETGADIKPAMTIDEVRRRARIDIMLPDDMMSDDRLDKFEPVIVNGETTMIKKGELVTVNWLVFEALINSGKYTPEQILK